LRRGWRYSQHRARALFVQSLVLPHAGRYTCPDQGTQMLVIDQFKYWLSKFGFAQILTQNLNVGRAAACHNGPMLTLTVHCNVGMVKTALAVAGALRHGAVEARDPALKLKFKLNIGPGPVV
jgi:hypothetical protein